MTLTERCGSRHPRANNACVIATSNPAGHVWHHSLNDQWREPCVRCGDTDREAEVACHDDGVRFVRCADHQACAADAERADR